MGSPTIYQVENDSPDDIPAASPPMSLPARILIVGLSAGGADSLPTPVLERIMTADLLAGGQRHLGYFPHFKGTTLTITANIAQVAERLQQALDNGQKVVVLASGDPLCYGIGASLRRYFPAEQLEIMPAPSAFQLAFAALAEPWSEAVLLSAHARPLPEVVAGVQSAPKAAILTDLQHTPAVIAQALLQAGLPPALPCAICENLGSPEQRVVHTLLGRVDREMYAPLNVFVVWQSEGKIVASPNVGASLALVPRGDCEGAPLPPLPIPPGLPDEAFSTSAAQITKREIRLLSLAELALGPGEVMWDIGAGSGAVGIEAARAQPLARVYAVEKRAGLCEHLRENLGRFPAPNLRLTQGVAPEATGDWPAPQSIFIGGSGGRLAEIIQVVRERLSVGGRLVINLATMENLGTTRSLLPEARVVQVQVNRGVPILEMIRLEALNPVFIVTWRKK